MKKAMTFVAVIGVALLAAVALNPSADRHRQQIKNAVADRSPVAGLFGVGALTAFVSDYHSWGVASYTSINGRTVSVGVLGMVFVLDHRKER